MSLFNRNLKRKRVVSLVKGTIKRGVINDETLGSFIKNFSSELPIFFFDTVDDGNVAGLILATMLENEILGIRQVDSSGYIFIKFTAEMDSDLFEKKAPRIFEHIRSMNLLNSYPASGTLIRSINT
ncbi:MAG: hypothetical protein GY875_01515 [Gammaproteobacteria bacterium]|nr:hypothetical protein [Gammaproteobacteria bacterium]